MVWKTFQQTDYTTFLQVRLSKLYALDLSNDFLRHEKYFLNIFTAFVNRDDA